MNLRYLEPVFFTYLPFAKGDAEGFQIPLSPPFIKVGDNSNLIVNVITMTKAFWLHRARNNDYVVT